jgi:hypothetical protein
MLQGGVNTHIGEPETLQMYLACLLSFTQHSSQVVSLLTLVLCIQFGNVFGVFWKQYVGSRLSSRTENFPIAGGILVFEIILIICFSLVFEKKIILV